MELHWPVRPIIRAGDAPFNIGFLLDNTIRLICKQANLECLHFSPVHGGDINQAFCIYTSQGKYFVKINSAADYPAMFEREAEGLKALCKASKLYVPQVIAHGITGAWQWLLLDWVEKGNIAADFWEQSGRGLAEQHRNNNSTFGWPSSNYIGSLVQQNTATDNWAGFYSQQRIIPLSKKLFEAGLFSKKEMDAAENIGKKMSEIYPEEAPALLHGDLWAGNFMANQMGQPCIYDPAIYYGHREMDIGMTLLFGGFDQQFYLAYEEAYPLENKWRERLPFTQLYPLLVHAVLFGGHYVQSCRQILLK